MRQYIGYSCILFNLALILINSVLMLRSTFKRLYYKLKLRYLLKVRRVKDLAEIQNKISGMQFASRRRLAMQQRAIEQ